MEHSKPRTRQTSLQFGKSLRKEINPEMLAPLKLKMDCERKQAMEIIVDKYLHFKHLEEK